MALWNLQGREMKFLRIREWAKYQHYHDRNPPWIKLHRDLLNSFTWVTLDDDSRLLAIVCMVLAAETGNRIPLDRDFIQRRAHFKKRPDTRPLIDVGFAELIEESDSVADASANLAGASTVTQDARPERETETEKRERKRKIPLPPDFCISDSLRNWAEKHGYGQLEARFEHFTGYARANGKLYLDWDQAFQNAVRDDWAKLNGRGNGNGRQSAFERVADEVRETD